jgi:proton-dependent oligopeptide transporter, POT family
VIGGTVLTVGYAALALGQSTALYLGLGLVVLGTGFFKPNGYTIVGQLYGPGDPRRDSGFTFYYMAINVGALLGPLVCAWLAADPRYGWSYGFGAAGAGMLCGLIFYLAASRSWLRHIGLPPARGRGPVRPPAPLTAVERQRMVAIGIITLFVVFFWLAFEQVGSSLNVFAAHRTDRVLGDWARGLLPGGEIPAAWFQSINPLFILLLAPLAAGIWRQLGPRAPSTPAKMALGLMLLGAAYLVLVLGAAQGGRVSPWFLVAFYFVYTCGELCFLPVGISFVSQTAPARFASMLMGAWLTANFFASLAGGYLAGMVQRIERGELFTILGGQADFFLIFVVSCWLAGSFLALLVPTLKRLI